MKHSPVNQTKQKWLLFFLFSLALLALACQAGDLAIVPATAVAPAPADNPQQDPFQPSPTRTAVAFPILPGQTRANPLPVGETAVAGQFSATILETLRGDDAWQAVHQANPNNKQPVAGWEYLLLKISLRNNDTDPEQDRSAALHVTGNGRVVHFSFNTSAVPPTPSLENTLPGGEVSEGWETYLIHAAEGNLILQVEDLFDYQSPPTYLAIDEGASIPADNDTVRNIPPTDLGLTAAQPVPFGQTATAEDWQIIILDVKTGEEAWQQILAANQFNDPPPEGMTYILVHIRARYIGLQEEAQNISDRAFTLLTAAGEELPRPSVVDPEPELYYDLFAGGEVDGWIVLLAPQEAKNLALYFNPPYDRSGANERYLSLGQGR